MYDSVTPSAIPADAPLVAGYINGPYAWTAAEWARFPHSVKVRISVRAAANDGHVCDCEQGDLTPAQAVQWVVMRRKAGADPSVYCNSSTWPTVQAAFRNAGVAQPHYWIAHYDGSTAIPAGAVAKQYDDPPKSGGNYDISAVADHWPGVDEEDDVDLTAQNLKDIGHAAAAYHDPTTGVDANQRWNDAAAVLPVVQAMSKQLAAITGSLSANQAALLAAIAKAGQHVDVELSDAQVAALSGPIVSELAALPGAVRLAIGQALVAQSSGS